MSHGYIYCFSNPRMPGCVKVGMTTRTPTVRLKEANKHYTWGLPKPFKIEFAKKVINPRKMEKKIHNLLKKWRSNPRMEFFDVSKEKVHELFDRIPGTMWRKHHEDEEDDSDYEEEDSEYEEEDDADDSDYEVEDDTSSE